MAEQTSSGMFTNLRDVAEHTAARAAADDAPAPTDAALRDGADAAAHDGGGSDRADDEGPQPLPTLSLNTGDVMCLKSLCVSCEDEGVTNLLLTRIPFFRDVILMAFECEHCGYRSSELQSAEVQEKGCRFEVTVATIQVRRAWRPRGRAGDARGTTCRRSTTPRDTAGPARRRPLPTRPPPPSRRRTSTGSSSRATARR